MMIKTFLQSTTHSFFSSMFSLTSQGERGTLISSVIVTSNKWLFLPKWMKSQSSLSSAAVIPLIPSDLLLGYPCVTHMTASQILASFRDFHGSVLVSFLLVLSPHLYITSYLDFFFMLYIDYIFLDQQPLFCSVPTAFHCNPCTRPIF